jgi:hypothetical protein
MEEMDKEKKPRTPLSLSSLLSLIVGLAGIAATLYISFSNRPQPELTIEFLPPITYASTSTISSLGDVTFTINGEEIKNLIAIPFVVKNTGNTPISSIQTSGSYNMLQPININLVADDKTYNPQILAVQSGEGGHLIETSFSNNSSEVMVIVDIKNLNPSEEASFTVFYTGDREPSPKINADSLQGGKIILVSQSSAVVDKETAWGKFKSVLLAQIIGAIFLAQIPIVLIFLIVNARNVYKQEHQMNSSPEQEQARKNAEEEQRKKVISELSTYIKHLNPEFIKKLKSVNVPIPLFNINEPESAAQQSVYEFFWEAFKDKWHWILKDKYPLPEGLDPMKQMSNWVSTPWFSWGHFITSAVLPLVLLSTLLGVFGYFLFFY